jgi:glycosyltransferase involved in cell wall biosynthesis
LGTSVLDAFAAGVPVVATAAGGIPEMVVHRKTGMLCPVRDARCLAASVLELLKDPALRNTIIEGAKSKLSDFSTKATAQKTLDVYKEIAL